MDIIILGTQKYNITENNKRSAKNCVLNMYYFIIIDQIEKGYINVESCSIKTNWQLCNNTNTKNKMLMFHRLIMKHK